MCDPTFTLAMSNQASRRVPEGHDYAPLLSFYQPIFSPLTVPSLGVTSSFGKDDNPSAARYHSSLSTMPETTVHFIENPSHLQHSPFTVLTQLDLDTIQNALRLLETNPEAIRTIASPPQVTNRQSDPFSAQMPCDAIIVDLQTRRSERTDACIAQTRTVRAHLRQMLVRISSQDRIKSIAHFHEKQIHCLVLCFHRFYFILFLVMEIKDGVLRIFAHESSQNRTRRDVRDQPQPTRRVCKADPFDFLCRYHRT